MKVFVLQYECLEDVKWSCNTWTQWSLAPLTPPSGRDHLTHRNNRRKIPRRSRWEFIPPGWVIQDNPPSTINKHLTTDRITNRSLSRQIFSLNSMLLRNCSLFSAFSLKINECRNTPAWTDAWWDCDVITAVAVWLEDSGVNCSCGRSCDLSSVTVHSHAAFYFYKAINENTTVVITDV